MAQLREGWEVAAAAPGGEPRGWLPARVPGTVAAALADAGREAGDLDARDWCFRTRFAAEEGESVLRLDGIATVAEVSLNGERILTSESMFARHAPDVGPLLRPENELTIRCRALAPLLAQPRKPRARWRTRLADGNLRWYRTMLLGRAPGFAPGPAAVGPWRPVSLEPRRAVEDVRLRARLDGDDGLLRVRASVRSGAALDVAAGEVQASFPVRDGVAAGELRLPGVAPWWPHTHGEPSLHEVRLRAGGHEVVRRVGFRSLSFGDVETDGLDLHVNGAPVFARGAVWTPVDFVSLAPSQDALREALEQARDAGMNMLRIAGTGCYESPGFHDLCDSLGILVWQDFMFANMDYPIGDEGFRALVEAEGRDVLARLGGRPSTVVLCGNSEVEQQVAMLGLDPALGRGELFGELLPRLVREAEVDAAYVPSAPCGGDLPFRPDRGIANYYGVGGYRRGLGDARRAGVRFAAECLAFANLGDDAGDFVPRDAGADWDFADVRDHYLELLFRVDAVALRASDPERYGDLSRAVTGEVMAEVFGEWRRGGSSCRGGLVLQLRDLVAGAGWGVVEKGGTPKVAYHHLRRALAPVAVWTTDEGLSGVDVHMANDRPDALSARLRVTLLRDLEQPVEQVLEEVTLPPRSTESRNVESMLGRFVDAAWAYRFGPLGHDAIVASLERGGEILSQAFRFPTGRPLDVEPPDRLGLAGRVSGDVLEVTSRRLAYGVRVHVPGAAPSDDAFCVEPGGTRRIALGPGARDGGEVSALNLAGRLAIEGAA